MSKTVLSLLMSLLLAAVAMSGANASAASQQVMVGKPSPATNVATSKKAKKKVAPARKAAKPRPSKPQPPVEAWNRPMTVVLVRSSAPGCEPLCPEWLAAEGRITEKTPAVFRKALQKVGKRWLPVVIRSSGGDVQAAMDIGRMIRKAGLPVGVGWTLYDGCAPTHSVCKPPAGSDTYRGLAMVGGGFCMSACPLILAGGTQRFAGIGTEVGLHVMRRQWFKERIIYRDTRRTVKGKQKVVREVVNRKVVGTYFKDGIDKEYRRKITAYLAEMGISGDYLEDMAKASYAELYRPTGERLRELRLVTSVETVTSFTNPSTCIAATPSRNCRMLDQQATEAQTPKLQLPTGDEMMVARMRAKGKCEPVCPEWIAAQGIITAETPRRFAAAFAQAGAVNLPVLIDSRGGDLDAAIEVGRMIRAREAKTLVATTMVFGCSPRDPECNRNRPSDKPYMGYAFTPGDCTRECWFVFAGGVQRLGIWTHESTESTSAPFVTRQAGRTAETIIAEFMTSMGLPKSSLAVDRAKLDDDLTSYDDNRIIMLRLSNDSGATNIFAEPASCRQADTPANCIRRDE